MSKVLSPTDKQSAESAFIHYLKLKRIKYTKPRRAILQGVLRINDHFEAEQLLAQLHLAGERVGKATVYRTLPLLVDCGVLKQVRFSDKQAHFEHAFGEDAHDHMVCRRCGRIIEFSSERIEKLRALIAKEENFHAIAHRFQISGLCQTCVQSCPVEALS